MKLKIRVERPKTKPARPASKPEFHAITRSTGDGAVQIRKVGRDVHLDCRVFNSMQRGNSGVAIYVWGIQPHAIGEVLEWLHKNKIKLQKEVQEAWERRPESRRLRQA